MYTSFNRYFNYINGYSLLQTFSAIDKNTE